MLYSEYPDSVFNFKSYIENALFYGSRKDEYWFDAGNTIWLIRRYQAKKCLGMP
jgi:hypothetical protein